MNNTATTIAPAAPGNNQPVRSTVLFLSVLLAAWPVFAVCSVLLALWQGEAAILDAWELEPKRLLITQFLSGFTRTLPIALLLATLVLADHFLIVRRLFRPHFCGLLVLTVFGALALWLSSQKAGLMIPLLLTLVIIVVLYRLFASLFRMNR